MKKPRKFVKGHSPYGAWIGCLVIAGIAFALMLKNKAPDAALFSVQTAGYWALIAIFLLPTISEMRTKKVWISNGSTVYHSKEGCCGANKKVSLWEVEERMEPCSKCHKIQGMNRN